MAFLHKVTLQNYKSIPWSTIDFSNLTVLLGRNGSGKSNIADALAFISEATTLPLQAVFNRRGGPASVIRKRPSRATLSDGSQPLGLAFEFKSIQPPLPEESRSRSPRMKDARYSVQIQVGRIGFSIVREQCWVTDYSGRKNWFDRRGQSITSNVEFLANIPESIVARDALALPFIGGLQPFRILVNTLRSMAVYAIEPAKLREFQDPDSGERLSPDGSNAASVLREMAKDDPESLARMLEVLASVVPELKAVRANISGRKQILRFTQKWSEHETITFDSFNMSDGTLRAFGLLLAVFQSPRPSILLIEEPEISLHPAATAVILDVLKSISDRTQVICTTHSPEVLDHISPNDDSIRVVAWKDGMTNIGRVDGIAKNALQKHLSTAGELLRMMVLDADPIIEDALNPQASLFEELS